MMRDWSVTHERTARAIQQAIDDGVSDESFLGGIAYAFGDSLSWTGGPEPDAETQSMTREDFFPQNTGEIPLDRISPEESDALIRALVGYVTRVIQDDHGHAQEYALAGEVLNALFCRH